MSGDTSGVFEAEQPDAGCGVAVAAKVEAVASLGVDVGFCVRGGGEGGQAVLEVVYPLRSVWGGADPAALYGVGGRDVVAAGGDGEQEQDG